jgi:hypothetical protein
MVATASLDLSGNPIDTTRLIEVAILAGELVVVIEGGNRMNGW